jgi:hypothetical protein
LPLVGVMMTCAALAHGQEQDKSKAGPIERITLQYRVARDALAPSRFVAMIDDGVSPPLELTWALPMPEEEDRREALEKQRTEFHKLIEGLEAKQINGVEFECEGQWIQRGALLRITTVPEITPAGRQKIKGSGG